MNKFSTFTIGRFTVRVGLRPDNPAFPRYLVYIGEVLIGANFSFPDVGCCEYLERMVRVRKEEQRQAERLGFVMKQWSAGRRRHTSTA